LPGPCPFSQSVRSLYRAFAPRLAFIRTALNRSKTLNGEIDNSGRIVYDGGASKSGKVVHFLRGRCAMVTYDALFAYSMVLIGLASLIYTVTRHKK
jgi:hypothetical protein